MNENTEISSISPRRGRKAFDTADQAPGVATQEATHGDSNWITRQTAKETAVAIRKQAEPANGYREAQAAAEAAAPMIDAIRANSVTMPKGELMQSLSLAQGLGMFQAFDLMSQFSGIARLKWLTERKQSGDYKGVTVIDRWGKSQTLNTFEELCLHVGSSYRKVAEDLQNLSLFGEEFMKTAEALGLGYRDLRLLRKGIAALPPEERQAILEEVESAEGPEELKDRLADLRTELAEARTKTKELEATLQAKDEVAKKRSAKLEELETRLERLDSMTPDEKETADAEANAKARSTLDERCRDVFVAVINLCAHCSAIFGDDRSSNDLFAYTHERVSLLLRDCEGALAQSGVDASFGQIIEVGGGLTNEDSNDGTTAEALG